MYVTRYQPLSSSLDNLLNEFLRPANAADARAEIAPIRVDVKESADAYAVHAELPGVKKEDIHVEVEGNEVTIGAEVKREAEAKDGERWLRSERFYGKSERRFALPHEVDETKADAKFRDGVLELTLPKRQNVTGRKLAVQ